MTRLTFQGNFCQITDCPHSPCLLDGECLAKQAWEELKAYEDTGLAPKRCAELAKADADGLLVVLPQKEIPHAKE